MEATHGERAKRQDRQHRNRQPRDRLGDERQARERQDEGEGRAEADEDREEGGGVHFDREAEEDDDQPEEDCHDTRKYMTRRASGSLQRWRPKTLAMTGDRDPARLRDRRCAILRNDLDGTSETSPALVMRRITH